MVADARRLSQRAYRCGLSLTREGPCRGLSVKMVAALEPHEERCTEWCLPVSASVLPMRSRRLCRKMISVARANTLPSRQRGAEAQRTHTSYTQITGLYATSSYSTYVKQALVALRWIADRYGCKRLEECRPYLPAYYAEMQARGLSAWTVRTRVYALCSVYGADYATLFWCRELAGTPPRCDQARAANQCIGQSAPYTGTGSRAHHCPRLRRTSRRDSGTGGRRFTLTRRPLVRSSHREGRKRTGGHCAA